MNLTHDVSNRSSAETSHFNNCDFTLELSTVYHANREQLLIKTTTLFKSLETKQDSPYKNS